MSLVIHWFSLTVPCLFIITNEATTILTQRKMYSCINALSRFMVFCIYLQKGIYKKIIINILLKITYKIYSSFLKKFYFIDYTYFVEWYKQLKDKHVAISSLSLFCISCSWNSGI